MRNVAAARTLASFTFLALSFSQAQTAEFALHDGDRVVFYGDSITDNAYYTKCTETYVRTHFPKLNVRFFNAGVGGDRVSGGWMGPIDQRLTRDLFSRKPTVITIMLGMNDGSYQGFNQGIFDTYRTGYEHILDRIKTEAPNARVWLIQPSPYDDVTRDAMQPMGYNTVLKKYADYLAGLAKARNLGLVDFNTPLVDALTRAKAIDPKEAALVIPDRVHPDGAGHLLMAAELVKAWGAPAETTSVEVKTGPSITVTATGTDVKNLQVGVKTSWTQMDHRLPFPLDAQDELTKLMLNSSPLAELLGPQRLAFHGMAAGSYTLSIDGKALTTLTAAQLDEGVNLNAYKTPMIAQAQALHDKISDRANLRYQAWRNAEFSLSSKDYSNGNRLMDALTRFDDEVLAKSMAQAKPAAHQYVLEKI